MPSSTPHSLIRIAVVDDHPLFREGVAHTLSSAGGFDVIAQGASAGEAVRIAHDLQPDIILLDVSMPGSGLEAARSIATVAPSTLTIMLTVSESEEHVAAALDAGARGYLVKGSSASELLRTVQAVFNGESYISPGLAARLLMQVKQQPHGAMVPEVATELTAREDEILTYVSRGLTNKEIANKLDLSEKTVKHYMTSIMQKLHVRNRVEAVLATRRNKQPN